MKTSAEITATAAQESVDAAKKSMDVTIKQFQLDQRAWVGVEGIDGVPVANKPYTFVVGFRNSGKTPAKNVGMQFQFNPIRQGQVLKYTYDHPKSSKGFIPPNGTFTSGPLSPSQDTPVKESEIALIKSGELRAYLYGNIAYEDVFGRPHWTNFCYMISRDAKSYIACNDYNGADEEKLPIHYETEMPNP